MIWTKKFIVGNLVHVFVRTVKASIADTSVIVCDKL